MAHNVQAALTGSGLGGQGKPYTAELWDGFDPMAMDRDVALGTYDQVDFVNDVPVIATNLAVANFGNWNGFTGLTAATVGPSAIQGGAIELAGTTDNMDVYLQRGPIGSRPYALVYSSEVTAWPYHHLARVRFECRVSPSTVVAESMGWFVGLAGVIADNDLDDNTSDVVGSKNFFGWSVLNGAAAENATPRFIYQSAANTAPTVVLANAGTMVANKWYTLGFDFNPAAPKRERVALYFNGVKSGTFITDAAVAAATFPKTVDGSTMVNLAPSFLMKPGTTAACALTISNFRISQEVMIGMGNEASA